MVSENRSPDPLGDALHAAAEVQEVFLERGWRFCFIGGIALQRWGEPRVTLDVDVTLLTGFGQEESFIEELLGRFQPRRADASAFALRHRVLLLQNRAGVGLDIALAALPFEENVVLRASMGEYLPGMHLLTCSAEDLVVMKSFAARDRDWNDVRTIAARQGSRLDVPYIRKQLHPLLVAKEQPELLEKLLLVFKDEGVL
ncbi:MAG TPA: hypothetical protein PKE12_06980 [Kiritimatiellia bacterium]|nr:hypothetical protein [Kiritimatiellia bacterium]